MEVNLGWKKHYVVVKNYIRVNIEGYYVVLVYRSVI